MRTTTSNSSGSPSPVRLTSITAFLHHNRCISADYCARVHGMAQPDGTPGPSIPIDVALAVDQLGRAGERVQPVFTRAPPHHGLWPDNGDGPSQRNRRRPYVDDLRIDDALCRDLDRCLESPG